MAEKNLLFTIKVDEETGVINFGKTGDYFSVAEEIGLIELLKATTIQRRGFAKPVPAPEVKDSPEPPAQE